jgi:hypothetical protein
VLTAFIFIAVIIYKKQREKSEWDNILKEQHGINPDEKK